MKILIIGAGKEKSLGTLLRNSLTEHKVILASRRANPSLDVVECDISDAVSVEKLVSSEKPDCLILAAGVYPEPVELGQINDWKSIEELIKAKVLGCLVALNAAAKYDVKYVIALAGSTIHADHRLLFYSLVNGGILAAMQSMEIHQKMQCVFVSLGPVPNSTMGDRYLSDLPKEARTKTSCSSIKDLVCVVSEILDGKRDGIRHILGCRLAI